MDAEPPDGAVNETSTSVAPGVPGRSLASTSMVTGPPFRSASARSSTATGGGDAHSAEAVRHRIKDLTDAEAPNNILSDDTIVVLLRKEGMDIARRTVAKYRDALRIPSSVQRKREKAVPA